MVIHNILKKNIIFLSICFLSSCGLLGIYPRDRLSIKKSDQREVLMKHGLKIDGAYITKFHTKDTIFHHFIILYQDGMVFKSYVVYPDLDVMINALDSLKNLSYVDKDIPIVSMDMPQQFGLYEITNDDIYMEVWSDHSYTFSLNAYGIQKIKGKILDGSTIVLFINDKERIYNFYPLKNKPDSTNRFIK